MASECAVLGKNNGSLHSSVVFIAEAPGRFGSGRTGIPFYGDKSGENFQELIDHVGLTREDIFITNAVLCNPISEGVNSRPTAKEIKNCSGFLKSTLDLIQPKLVVTLGGVGLEAINRLLGTRYKLNDHAARLVTLEKFQLLPLYHPSPRVANWRRPLQQQKKDFRLILKALKVSA
ncbi:MAG: uracil-DNA glycosylase [Candidatus Nitronauta litoralis]|uniref:Uracil-DNA glycosylase n=1 Tax=Candidatus Nitronauta litoralis TaxID=2705533 RepID=A0A7T0BZ89_9BACT|nr:MAG: uracil-DNA glycosylase [Candidatus Nitronauta litoralis]